jgi:hypothetical protein
LETINNPCYMEKGREKMAREAHREDLDWVVADNL